LCVVRCLNGKFFYLSPISFFLFQFFVYSAFVAGGPLLSDRFFSTLHSPGSDLIDPHFRNYRTCDVSRVFKYEDVRKKTTQIFDYNCRVAQVLGPIGWFLLIPIFTLQLARVMMLILTRFKRKYFIGGLIWDFIVAVSLMATYFCYDTGTKAVMEPFFGGWLMFNQVSVLLFSFLLIEIV
jgi:hypothetical protein